TAYKILYMLRGGIEERGGTSGGLSWEVKKDNQIGGKTGTTNNASDGWYMGVTKDLVAGGWVGGDERNIHFRSWADGSGGKTARPIWDLFMQKVYNDPELNITRGSFPVPKEGLDIELDCSLHHLDSDSAVVVEKPWNPDGF
ncbi:MAG: penicillin-binding protein, partial [Cyclobacteriaceae bacterium]|nr:penicillin-binding protein [Cyclobacteriaceae bacterium]